MYMASARITERMIDPMNTFFEKDAKIYKKEEEEFEKEMTFGTH